MGLGAEGGKTQFESTVFTAARDPRGKVNHGSARNGSMSFIVVMSKVRNPS
jgi:hypothetical protein